MVGWSNSSLGPVFIRTRPSFDLRKQCHLILLPLQPMHLVGIPRDASDSIQAVQINQLSIGDN